MNLMHLLLPQLAPAGQLAGTSQQHGAAPSHLHLSINQAYQAFQTASMAYQELSSKAPGSTPRISKQLPHKTCLLLCQPSQRLCW
jgi:hypothetical protein